MELFRHSLSRRRMFFDVPCLCFCDGLLFIYLFSLSLSRAAVGESPLIDNIICAMVPIDNII